MDIAIRRGTIHDALLLSQLSTITFLDTFRGTCTDEEIEAFVEKYFNVDQTYKELQDENDFYFIALADQKAVGYIRMKDVESDVPLIKRYKAIELKEFMF